jgi:glycosyltransferase involved in cell wall biosynthesis
MLELETDQAPHDEPRKLRRDPDRRRLDTACGFATVRDLIQVADLALCPRREWSGFPMKLLNYMAAAKAVVVSAGSAKAVRHGLNGVVVRDDDAAAYAAAILDLLADPARRRQLGAAARRTVEDEYGWERVIDQVEATYATVLARRAAVAPSAARPLGILEA